MEIIGYIILSLVIICIVAFFGIIVTHKIEESNGKWVYSKTGNEYYVEGEIKMKDPTTGEWKPAILYYSVKDGEGYVREYQDFITKFHKKGEE